MTFLQICLFIILLVACVQAQDVIKSQQPKSQQNIGDQKDEILETANSVVFRPIFTYRKTVNQRRRVYPTRRPTRTFNF